MKTQKLNNGRKKSWKRFFNKKWILDKLFPIDDLLMEHIIDANELEKSLDKKIIEIEKSSKE